MTVHKIQCLLHCTALVLSRIPKYKTKYVYHTIVTESCSSRPVQDPGFIPEGVSPNRNFDVRAQTTISTAPVGGQTQSADAWQLAYRATPTREGGEQSVVPLWCTQKSHYAWHNLHLSKASLGFGFEIRWDKLASPYPGALLTTFTPWVSSGAISLFTVSPLVRWLLGVNSRARLFCQPSTRQTDDVCPPVRGAQACRARLLVTSNTDVTAKDILLAHMDHKGIMWGYLELGVASASRPQY
jgi:hypothetical protein